MAKTRYIGTVDFYFWVKEGDDPKKILQRWCNDQNVKEDNQTQIVSIHKQEFGTLNCEIIYPK